VQTPGVKFVVLSEDEPLMHPFKTPTGNRLSARHGSQATKVSIRTVVPNRTTALARPQSVRIE
jgi:hypothetical protein